MCGKVEQLKLLSLRLNGNKLEPEVILKIFHQNITSKL